MISHPDAAIMSRAIELASEGGAAGDYRLGALVVGVDGIVAEAHTDLEATNDPTAHAEVLAIRRAATKLNTRYLAGRFLYTTLEPCPMCTSAAIWAKMAGIVFGATLEDALERGGGHRDGQFFSWRQITIKSRYVVERGTPLLELYEAFMRADCLTLLPAPQ